MNPLVQMALRRARPGTGSSEQFLNWRTAVQSLPIPNLPTILEGIPWVLIGGLATRAYMPERTTQDIDILIHTDMAAQARDALTAAQYVIESHLAIGGFAVRSPDHSVPLLDVITSRAPWVQEVLKTPTYDAAGLPVIARPYLMLLKLQAGRLRDLDDVQRMLRGTPPPERESTRRLLATYAPDVLEDYDALIHLANVEFGGG